MLKKLRKILATQAAQLSPLDSMIAAWVLSLEDQGLIEDEEALEKNLVLLFEAGSGVIGALKTDWDGAVSRFLAAEGSQLKAALEKDD